MRGESWVGKPTHPFSVMTYSPVRSPLTLGGGGRRPPPPDGALGFFCYKISWNLSKRLGTHSLHIIEACEAANISQKDFGHFEFFRFCIFFKVYSVTNFKEEKNAYLHVTQE